MQNAQQSLRRGALKIVIVAKPTKLIECAVLCFFASASYVAVASDTDIIILEPEVL